MAIWRIYDFQPLRSRWDDCIKRAVENKVFFERFGARSRLFRAADGGPYVRMWFITEVDDWIQQGELGQKTEADPEYQLMLGEGLSDPVHENFSVHTLVELPMPEASAPPSHPLKSRPEGESGSKNKRAAIWQIHDFEPLRARWDGCLERAVENKRFFDTLGVSSRLFQGGPGDPSGAVHMLFINEVEDWARLGELNHRCESHPEYKRMGEEGLADPVHTNYSVRTMMEVPLDD